ncbi:MAG: 4-(cytidine 5'-diphospho)-2-C-methyl-D-erythritol kinase [Caulobacteraceae bacterium]|nr:4-(cytidine 5'-diphospho)-2-C-methyl-D-erythritol kinase [Caulobacteraceae bacterium]
MQVERFAPAKVNLFLHVGPPGADGYHPLCSLVTFADVGDVVGLSQGESGFAIEGPFAAELSPSPDNLVARARDRLLALYPGTPPKIRLTLDKRLPIAAGLGGGSSDAAAALALLAQVLDWPGPGEPDVLATLASALGADVPMCLGAAPRLAEGRGEVLSPPPTFPDLEAVLVNPGLASPTGRVYAAYDAMGAPGGAERPAWPEAMETPAQVAAFLARCRNDLEAPAIRLEPQIGETLALLRARREALIARMSGSGATCFVICADEDARDGLARELAQAHPGWWVRACRLSGFRA